jgi:hypothetical protein
MTTERTADPLDRLRRRAEAKALRVHTRPHRPPDAVARLAAHRTATLRDGLP